MSHLADRLLVLRDEVLVTVERGQGDPPGSEIFDAVVRGVAALDDTTPGIDLTLHDAIARRLAWGDTETSILGDAEDVFARLIHAAHRSLRDPQEEALVLDVASQVVTAAARIVAVAAASRASRERATRLREEIAQKTLHEVLEQQRDALARLTGG